MSKCSNLKKKEEKLGYYSEGNDGLEALNGKIPLEHIEAVKC